MRPTSRNERASIAPTPAVAARVVAAACAVSAGAHAGLVPEHLREAPQLGVAFVLAAGLLLAAATALAIRPGSLGVARGTALLLVGLLPHALPELTALFLPLAAWVIASRRQRWEELLAATVMTVAIAVPVLIVSAFVELYLSPRLIIELAGG